MPTDALPCRGGCVSSVLSHGCVSMHLSANMLDPFARRHQCVTGKAVQLHESHHC